MPKLLRIDSSARIDGSLTRDMTDAFTQAWKVQYPNGDVIVRDLALTPPNPFSAEMSIPSNKLREDYTEEDHAAMAESDELIDEIVASDHIVIGAPMYNFGVPSTLKAWIDQVVIAPKSFAVDFEKFDGSLVGTEGSKGMLLGKKLVVAMSRGCDYTLPQNEPFDLLEPFLRRVFEFIGITDVHFVDANAMVFCPPGEAEKKLEIHKEELAKLARTVFSS